MIGENDKKIGKFASGGTNSGGGKGYLRLLMGEYRAVPRRGVPQSQRILPIGSPIEEQIVNQNRLGA